MAPPPSAVSALTDPRPAEISREHPYRTPDELAIWLRETSGKTAERRLAATEHLVRERRADSLPWLRDLLRDRRRNVRHWAVDVGSEVYEREFVLLLLARLSDGSLEVRNHVLVHLRMLDPEALRPQLPRIRRWLHRPVDHPIDYKPMLMTLAELRDRESIQDIEVFIREMGIARNWPYYARLGRDRVCEGRAAGDLRPREEPPRPRAHPRDLRPDQSSSRGRRDGRAVGTSLDDRSR